MGICWKVVEDFFRECSLDPPPLLLLKTHYEMVENAPLNLISQRSKGEAGIVRHVLNSLLGLLWIPKELRSISQKGIDIGSGGGFPLFPLALSLPQWEWVGVESIGKKAKYLVHMASVLQTHIQILNIRAEALLSDFEEQFDWVTARAVAPLPTLLSLTLPFAKVGGYVLLWKGKSVEEELVQSQNIVWRRASYGETTLLCIQKTSQTKNPLRGFR